MTVARRGTPLRECAEIIKNDAHRVPVGVGNSVEWDPQLAPYVVEPMNCLASREYDAVIFVGPARTGKTIGLIDGYRMSVKISVMC